MMKESRESEKEREILCGVKCENVSGNVTKGKKKWGKRINKTQKPFDEGSQTESFLLSYKR